MDNSEIQKDFSFICSKLIGDGKVAGSLSVFLQQSSDTIGEYFGADRVWFYNFSESKQPVYEWAKEGVLPFSEISINPKRKLYLDEKYFLEKLKMLAPVVGNRDLLEPSIFYNIKQNGIKNFVLIPIPSAGKLWGVLGLEFLEEHFVPKGLLSSLDEIAIFFSGGLARFELNLKLEEAKTQQTETTRMLQTLLANIPGAAYRCYNDNEWTMLFLSDGVTQLTGYRPEDFISGNIKFANIILPEFREELWVSIQEALRENSSFEVQYAVNVKGQIRWFWERGRKIGIEENGKILLEGFITDVTDRVVAQLSIEETKEKLKSSENELRLSFFNAPIGIALCKLDGSIVNVNNAFAKTLGYSAEELLGRKYRDFVFSPDLYEHNRIETRIKQGVITPKREKYSVPKRFVKKDGVLVFSVLHITVVFDENGASQHAVIMLEDITIAKKAEEAALKALIEGEDKERARIAKEIHDGLCQDLTAALLSLETFRELIREQGGELFGKYITSLKFIQDAIDESRNLSHNLMPKAISDFGLVITLKSIINKLKSTTPIKFNFYDNLNDDRLSLDIEFNLYRIAQECLNNVIKHASAKEVSIQIIKHSNSVIFTIEDDGLGMDLTKPGKIDGIGLFNMKNRTKALSGNFLIESKPRKGTSITIEIPFKDDSN
ncbi:MAG: PAS domain S-box protein [Flavobacteriales bacterium]